MMKSTDPRNVLPGGTPEAADLIPQFLEWKRHNQNRSARTVQAYGDYLARLLEFASSINRDPLQLDDNELVAFTGVWLHRQGVQAIARKPYIAAVRGFFRWLHMKKITPGNAAAALDYPQPGRRLPSVMSLRSAEKLMYAPDFNTFIGVRDGAIMAVLLGCGFRIQGLVALNEGNIAQTEFEGRVRTVFQVTEKGDKQRLLPVPQEAEMMLRLYLEHPELKRIDRTTRSGDQVLFVSTNNRKCSPAEYIGERRRITAWSVNDMIKRYGKKLGIPPAELHAHAMRHRFGTELIESDVQLLKASELLGHEDPKNTKIYTHLALQSKFRESDRANPLSKIRTPMGDLLKQLPPGAK